VDNDFSPGVLGFSSPTFFVDENGTNAVITITRTNGSAGSVQVDYSTVAAGSSASAGVDYTFTSGTMSFFAGQTSNTFVIPIIDDTISEPDETVQIVLSNPKGGATLGLTNATLTIIDNDFGQGRLSFESATYSVSENGGNAAITVVRRGGNVGALSVDYRTANGTAFAGTNYTSTSGTLNWAVGDTATKTFLVPIIDDSLVQGDRTVNLILTNASVPAAMGTQSNAVLTIVEDDAYGSLSFSRANYSVNESGGTAIFTVVRTGGVAGTVSVRYDTVPGGTAVAGTDYTPASSFVVLTNGQTSANFPVAIINNTLPDGNRTVRVALTSPTNATLTSPTTAVLVIVDDETVNTSAGTFDTTFASTGTDNAVYALALQPDGNLILGGDFTTVNGVSQNRLARLDPSGLLDPSFNAGSGANNSVRALALYTSGPNAGRIVVGGLFSTFGGTNRNSVVRLFQNGGVDQGFDPGAGADNAIYALALQIDGKVVIGGGFSTFNGVTRNFAARLNSDGTLDTSFNPGTGPNGTVFAVAVQGDSKVLLGGDFTAVNGVGRTNIARLNTDGSVDLTFNPGTGADSTVRSIVVQSDGKIVIGGSFTTYNGAGLGRIARLLSSGAIDTSFNPGTGANNAIYYLTVQDDAKILVAGDFTSYNGVSRNRLARLNADGSVDPTINIGSGANNFVAAAVVQVDEKIVIGGGFTIYNGTPQNYLARLNGGTVAGPGSLEFTAANYSVLENAGTVTIGVRRVGGTAGSASANFTTYDGTASTNGVNYIGTNGTLIYPAGETFQSFNVTILDDFIVNADRTVGLALGGFTNAAPGGQTNAVLTIVNDEGQLGFSSPTYSVSEGSVSGAATITVTRAGGSAGPASANFATTTNGTAIASVDYVPVSGTLNFASGETNKTFSITIFDDQLVEGNETVELVLTNLTGSVVAGQLTAILTIVDNDFAPGALLFSSPSYGISESTNTVLATITVVRTNGSTGVVSVNATTGDGTATAGFDYTTTSVTLSFADSETVKTFTVPVLADTVSETNETVNLLLSNPTGGATLGFPSTAVLNITNNDILIFGNLVFTATNYFAYESNVAATVTVARIGGNSGGIAVDYATTSGGTATTNDYVPTSGTLNWTNGDSANKTFGVTLINNNLVDGNKTVNLVLANATGGSSVGSQATATLTILDDDFGPGTLTLSQSLFSVVENQTNAVITVLRTNGFTGMVTAQYATTNGSALAYPGSGSPSGYDYTNTTGTLTFTNGVTNLTFNVPLIDNGLQDGSRLFGVRLFGTTGGALLGLTNATVRIVDNENPAGTVDAGFGIGSGANAIVYSVSIATNGQIVLGGDFTTFNGTIRQGVARLNPDGTLDIFDPGFVSLGAGPASVRSVAVYTNGISANKVVFGGRFTSVSGQSRNNIARLNSDGTLDAAFDVGAGANALVSAVAAQGDGRVVVGGQFTSINNTNWNFIARLTGSGAADPSFNLGAGPDGEVRAVAVQSDGKILLGGSFSVVSGVTNSRIARLNVDGTVDATFNSRRAVGSGAVYAIAVQGDGKVLIGGLFVATNSQSYTNVARLNSDGTIDATYLPGTGPNDIVTSIALQGDGKAVIGGGFTAVNGFTRNRLARLNSDGTVDSTINIGTGADNLVTSVAVQRDAKIVLSGAFTNFNGTAQNYITRVQGGANLGAGLLAYNSQNFTVSEAGTNAVITVVRVGGLSGNVTVDFATIAGGTAVAGTHYQPVSGTLFFQSGETLRTFQVPVNDDGLVQTDRTVQLTLTNATGGASLNIPPTSMLTIQENDSLFNFSSPTYSVSEAASSATINVVRTGGVIETAFVSFTTTTNGTAVAAVNYFPTNGTLTFGPGVASQTFQVPILDDGAAGANKTVGLNLAGALPPSVAQLGNLTNAVLTLVENRFAPGTLAFASATYSVVESAGVATLNVIRTNGSSGVVSVNFSTSDGAASAGGDYVTANGTLSFSDGETVKAFTVPIIDDGLVEGDETVVLALTNPTGGATLGLSNAVLTIVDDDFYGAFVFSQANYSVSEAGTNATITVLRTVGMVGTVTVDFATSDGTAVAGNKYIATNGTLIFPQGVTNRTFTVTVINNIFVDGDQTVNLRLSNPTGGAALGLLTNAVLTVLDNDVKFSFDAATYSVGENAGTASINVTRAGVTNVAAQVDFATSDGSATNGVHYTGSTNTLVFAINEISKTLSIPIFDNFIVDGNKTVNLRLFNPSPTNIATLGAIPNAVLTILDNDSSINFSTNAYTITESGPVATLTVLRAGQNTGTVSVAYFTTDGSAFAGSDYTTTSGTLNFASGETSKTINVPIIDDAVGEPNEAFTMTLLNPTPTNAAYLGSPGTATVTINDNDTSIAFSAANYSINKTGGVATITVTRSGLTNNLVTVNYATSDGTAQAGTDYQPSSGTLVFGQGQLTRTFGVTVINHPLSAPSLTVNLALSSPGGGANLGNPSNAVLTILDNGGTLNFSAANYSVGESAGTATVTVTRTSGASGLVTVDFATGNGSSTATAGLDYVATNGTLSWVDGDTSSKSFQVRIANDQVEETNETISVTISNVTGGGVLGSQNTATITIVDDDGQAGVDFSFDPGAGFNNSVFSVVQQTNGQLVVGGAFTTFNGASRTYVTRLNLDGTLDASFNSSGAPAATVRAVVLQPDGKVLIGGDFTAAGGAVRNRIARLNSDGTLDTTFVPSSGPNGIVRSVALQSGGKVVIAGEFTSVSGTALNRIARLNTSGSLDTTFTPGTGANGIIFAMAQQSDGKLLIGGAFTTYNGVGLNRIARLNADGTRDTTFNVGAGADLTVFAIAVQSDGKILIGGLFTSVAGATHNRIARLNADGSVDTSYAASLDDTVLGMAIQPDGKAVIGGNFQLVNGTGRTRIARLNTDGTLDSTFNPGTGADNLVYVAMIQSDQKVVIGGDFTTINGTSRNRIARLNGNSNTPIPTTLSTQFIPPSTMRLTITGEPGRQYRIEYSGDLETWNTLATVTNTTGTVIYDDNIAGVTMRFYRVVKLP
jgi:uncharacterized delta-60 repeat protein